MLRPVFLKVNPSDWKPRQEMQPDLQIKSKKISRSCSESVLYLPVGEYSSTTLQRSFAKERPSQLANGRRPNKKIRRYLVLRKCFRDRKSRCTINHTNITQTKTLPRSPVSSFAIRLRARFAPEDNKGRNTNSSFDNLV